MELASQRGASLGPAAMGDIEGTVNHFRQGLPRLNNMQEAEALRATIEDWAANLEIATQ